MTQQYDPVAWSDETPQDKGTLINAARLNQMQTAHHYADGFREVDAVPTDPPAESDYNVVVYCTADGRLYRYDQATSTWGTASDTVDWSDIENNPIEVAPSGTAQYMTYDGDPVLVDFANSADAQGKADKLTTARKFKVTDADASHSGTEVPFDGSAPVALPLPSTIKATLAGNADTATSATSAGQASKLSTARSIGITDADASHTGTQASFNGTADVTIKLPSTIKATLVGNQDTATNAGHQTSADSATKVGSATVGGSTQPVYINAGTPTACGSSLAVSVTGNAGTSTKLATARSIGITDADASHSGTAASFDGSADVTVKLPATIKADLVGNADTATSAGTATTAASVPYTGITGNPWSVTDVTV